MKIIWLPWANATRQAQVSYIAQRSLRAAIEQDAEIDNQVATLATFPFLGRIGKIEATRELVISHTPFIVIYEIKSETIRILQVLH